MQGFDCWLLGVGCRVLSVGCGEYHLPAAHEAEGGLDLVDVFELRTRLLKVLGFRFQASCLTFQASSFRGQGLGSWV